MWALISTVWAWSGDSYEILTLKAQRLMPPTLREMLEPYQQELIAGARGDASAAGCPIHKDAGEIFRSLSVAIDDAAKMVDEHKPFRDLAFTSGRIAHLAADLNDPLLSRHKVPRLQKVSGDYHRYIQKKKPRFRLTFSPYKTEDLESDALRARFWEASSRRASRTKLLLKAYYPKGASVPVSSNTFDDRSGVFGLSAQSYNSAFTDIVLSWSALWKRAHGDLHGTPFYEPTKTHKKSAAKTKPKK